MQFFGIGPLELLLILVLTVLVVGPERLPEVAGQLARWIRQAQAYANYVRKDFTEVIGELEKEVGASREDLETIRSVLTRDTKSVFEEIGKASKEIKEATDLEAVAAASMAPANGMAAATNGQAPAVPRESTALKESQLSGSEVETAPAAAPADGGEAADQEWFVPASNRRRRRGGDETA